MITRTQPSGLQWQQQEEKWSAPWLINLAPRTSCCWSTSAPLVVRLQRHPQTSVISVASCRWIFPYKMRWCILFPVSFSSTIFPFVSQRNKCWNQTTCQCFRLRASTGDYFPVPETSSAAWWGMNLSPVYLEYVFIQLVHIVKTNGAFEQPLCIYTYSDKYLLTYPTNKTYESETSGQE